MFTAAALASQSQHRARRNGVAHDRERPLAGDKS